MTEEDDKKEEEAKKAAEKAAAKNTDVGLPSTEEEDIVKEAKAVNEKKEELEKSETERITREEKLMDRKEALAKLGGGSPGGTKPIIAAPLTDTEYAEALERGEVNPLKEDGLI